MKIIIGKKYTFTYPAELLTMTGAKMYPDYKEHSGQTVTVIRKLKNPEETEAEWDMFEIKAADGWIGHADDGELTEAA